MLQGEVVLKRNEIALLRPRSAQCSEFHAKHGLPVERFTTPLSQARAHFCGGFPCSVLPNGFFFLSNCHLPCILLFST